MGIKPLNIAVAGLGTVGAGVLTILEKNAELFTKKLGKKLQVKVVCARDKNKPRDANFKSIEKIHSRCLREPILILLWK
jgi:homoserine dehydrogenase